MSLHFKTMDMPKQSVLTVCMCYAILTPVNVISSVLNVNTVVIWSPSESTFFTEAVNRTLLQDLPLVGNVTILEDSQIFTYFANEYKSGLNSWTVFADLRECACPEDIFREHVLAYISVTQISCPSLSHASRAVFVQVNTRTFDRGAMVAQLTNSTHKPTISLALLFDDSGEEYFFERSSAARLPLVFEISVPLVKCAASEQLKNLTAKTEIRDVVVVARAECITELLTEAYNLQLLFGRYRWILYPTNQQLPACPECRNVNGVILMEKHRPKDTAESRAGKLMQFVEKSLGVLENSLTTDEFDICNNCTSNDSCQPCIQAMQSAISVVEAENMMVFFKDNGTVRNNIVFDVYMMSPNMSVKVGEWSESGRVNSLTEDLFPHSKGDIVLRAVVIIHISKPFKLHHIDQARHRRVIPNRCLTAHARSQCAGEVLKCVREYEPPFVFSKETPNGTVYYGYSLDVLKRISDLVGFSYVVRECDNNDYGTSKGGGEWGGCIGNVMRGEADVIVGALTVTAEREEVVDFTLPYYDFAGIQILMKKPDTNVNLFYFVDVFTTEAWLCLFGVIVLTSVLLFAFEKFSPRGCSGKGKSESPHAFDLKESIWFVIGSVTLAGGGEPPRCLASRLLVAGFWFFSVVIMSTFTANLAAFLTVSRMGTTIASLDELAAQSDVKYSVVKESNVMAYFEHQAAIERNFYELWKNMSLGGTGAGAISEQSLAVWDYPLGDKFGNMWNSISKTGMLNSTHDGLEKVLKGNFALITESPVIKYLTSRDCSLTAVGDQFSVRPYAFALKEKSLFTSKFTAAILQLQKQRELEDLKRKWWEDTKVTCPADTRDQGLDLSSLTGTFIVMGGGLCLGLIMLGVEFLMSRRKKRQAQKKETTTEKEGEGNKAISTVDSTNLHNLATLDHLIMARELKKKLELTRSA